jgi:DNA-directed RNA polymerase sigma subunit (sigma70/sigma32)
MHEAKQDWAVPDEPGLQCYLRTIRGFAALTTGEESELLRNIRAGAWEALDALINANLRRVVSIAAEFLGQGLGYLDLIAEGTLGLISAARRCDEGRGTVFARCAEERIRLRIQTALGELD